jgi:formyltetrahydrofolate synthetase
MKAVKRLLNILIIIFMVVSSIRTIPNIINRKKPIDNGIVFNKEYIIGGINMANSYVIFIKSKNGVYTYTVYDSEDDLKYKINDIVTFRNLHNGGGVIVLSKNNTIMNTYYQVYDYIMFFLFIILPFCYYLLNYKIKIK